MDVRSNPRDPTSEVVLSELITTSISSSSARGLTDGAEELLERDALVHYFNLQNRGYTVHDISPERWDARFRIVDTVFEPESTVATDGRVSVWAGRPGLRRIPLESE